MVNNYCICQSQTGVSLTCEKVCRYTDSGTISYHVYLVMHYNLASFLMLDHFAAYFEQFFIFDKFLCHPFIRLCLRFMMFLYKVNDVQFYFQQLFDCFTCRFYFENVFQQVIAGYKDFMTKKQVSAIHFVITWGSVQCSVTMINIVKKYLCRKLHGLNTLIGCSDNSQSQAQNKYTLKNRLLQNNYSWLLLFFP